MYTRFLALAILLSSVFGAEISQIIPHDFSAMLKRGDTLSKRQGYYPSSAPCGSGTTCAEACGTGQVECPANVGHGVCFDPSLSQCCPDGSGYSCDSGYFCSSDGQKNTYCCPNGMDLGACAQAYSLTVSLTSQTGTIAIPSESETTTDVSFAAVPTSTTPIYITNTPSPSSSPTDESSLATTLSPTTPAGNGTYSTGAPPVEFPGVATKTTLAGIVTFTGLMIFAVVFMI